MQITNDLITILILIALNNLLSMTEAAFLSTRKARLQQMVNEGKRGAKRALALSEDPSRFLSVIQVGITLIDVMTGAIGGAALAEFVAVRLATIPTLEPYAEGLGLGSVVLVITYFSIVFGELVPKRVGILNPERIVAASSGVMVLLARILAPIVRLLSLSTEGVLRILGVNTNSTPPITEEELHVLIDEGTQAGVFDPSEQEMVSGVFRLGDRRVYAVMTPRTEIVWLDVDDNPEEIRQVLAESPYSRYPVCRGDLDDVLGIVSARDILTAMLQNRPLDLLKLLKPAIFIPETAFAAQALNLIKEHRSEMLIAIDEYGGVQGVLTMQDIVEEVVGEISEGPHALQRPDGSWLLDGMMSADDFKELFHIDALPMEDSYETLAGFVITQTGHIPRVGERFVWQNLTFEVLDMDGRRIDKLLVTTLPPKAPREEENDA